MLSQLPIILAWRNLTESERRLATSVACAAFAVVLMFMENGFRNALLDGTVAAIRRIDGQPVLINPQRDTSPSRCSSPAAAWNRPGASQAYSRRARSTSRRGEHSGGARSRGFAAHPSARLSPGATCLPSPRSAASGIRWSVPTPHWPTGSRRTRNSVRSARARDPEFSGHSIRIAGTFASGPTSRITAP